MQKNFLIFFPSTINNSVLFLVTPVFVAPGIQNVFLIELISGQQKKKFIFIKFDSKNQYSNSSLGDYELFWGE